MIFVSLLATPYLKFRPTKEKTYQTRVSKCLTVDDAQQSEIIH
jgi:hypothetical protein